MARVKDIINQWGKKGGPNPQRSDLWQVDLSFAIKGLNEVEGTPLQLPEIPRYFASSVNFPELKIKVDQVNRDSRVYNVPGRDEPIDGIKISFVMDDGGKPIYDAADTSQSTIYTILDVWRAVVRAGRGAVGSEDSILLGSNFKINYAFPVFIYLLKGQALPVAFTNSQVTRISTNSETLETTFEGGFISEELATAVSVQSTQGFEETLKQRDGLEVSGVYKLENCWLSGFKLGDVNYDRTSVLTVEATFFADNVLQVRRSDNVPSFL